MSHDQGHKVMRSNIRSFPLKFFTALNLTQYNMLSQSYILLPVVNNIKTVRLSEYCAVVKILRRKSKLNYHFYHKILKRYLLNWSVSTGIYYQYQLSPTLPPPPPGGPLWPLSPNKIALKKIQIKAVAVQTNLNKKIKLRISSTFWKINGTPHFKEMKRNIITTMHHKKALIHHMKDLVLASA